MNPNDNPERFLVQHDPEEPPEMHRLGEMGPVIDRAAEASHYGWHDDLAASLRIWRWAGPGVLEELHVSCVELDTFGGDDYAHPVWAALGEDGTAHIAISVRIDGRA